MPIHPIMAFFISDTLRTWRPAAGAEVRRFVEDVMSRVAQLPPEDQIGPRPTKQGSVDLTGGKLFLQDRDAHCALVSIAEKHSTDQCVSWDGSRQMKVHAVIRILLKSLHIIHTFWIQKLILTANQLLDYNAAICQFHKAWLALTWKPTVWVHWVCAHSSFYMNTYRSIQSFSSIPTGALLKGYNLITKFSTKQSPYHDRISPSNF